MKKKVRKKKRSSNKLAKKNPKKKIYKKKSKIKKLSKRRLIKNKKIKSKKKIKKKYSLKPIKINYSSKSTILKIVRFQDKLTSKFKFKINFSLERMIQGFFQKIDDKIQEYKFIRAEEKRRKQIEENKKMQREKAEADKEYKLQQKLNSKVYKKF